VGLRDADLFCHFETSGVDMNPLSPEQILRILENGYFMTHQEQAEAAQYIRQLQQENLTLLGKRETPEDLLRQSEREGWRYAKELEQELAKLKEKNGAL
jgi:hypothetical protein